MRILSNYVAEEFVKQFFVLLSIFVGIYLVVDLGRIAGFLKHGATYPLILKYYVYKTPQIVSQTVAAAVLFASSFALSNLMKHNEITAMNAAGVSIYRVLLPIIALAGLISLLTLLGNEYILPVTNKKMEYIKNVKIRGDRPRSIFKNGRIWFRGEGSVFYNIQFIDPKLEFLQGVTLFYFDEDFKIVRRVDAQKAEWQNGQWVFSQGVEYRFPQAGLPRSEKFEKMKFTLKESPQDFKQVERNPETMSYRELRRYIEDLRSKGYAVYSYLVDLYAKLSIPFISLVMSIIGAPFALRQNRSGGRAAGFAVTLGMGFLFWVGLALGLAVGHGGALPPIVAAWGANIIFGCVGFYFLSVLNL